MAITDLITLGPTGVSYPDYPTFLEAYKAEYRAIYGADANLDADAQDGQWLAIQALAIYDTMQIAAAVYSSQSPLTAQSDALTRNVRINGLIRESATSSTVTLTLVGTTGTVITNGAATDSAGTKWLLPSPTTITTGAGTSVVATAAVAGDVTASANTITNIATPTQGWSSVTNPAAATPGLPVESDFDLRARQRVSTMVPSLSVFEGIVAAVKAINGVGEVRGYENDTTTIDANLIPAHSIAIIAENAAVPAVKASIADVIATKKTAGTATYAAPSPTPIQVTVTDAYGEQNVITFGSTGPAVIKVVVRIQKLGNYDATTDAIIKQAVADYISAIGIGDDVYLSKLYSPANQDGTTWGSTYIVDSIWANKNSASTPTSSDNSNLSVAFNEMPSCTAANVTVVGI
jgi:uncharacterized phage protein gp47/JayE